MLADGVWIAVTAPIIVGAVLSFLIECLLQPGVKSIRKRPMSSNVIHIGLWLLLYSAELALFRRPWFAAANVLALLFLIVLVSNAKYHSLREPFIFQDFEYFTDALRHPRLYLPFLGIPKGVAAATGFGLALYLGVTLESSLSAHISAVEFLAGLACLIALGLVLLRFGAKEKLQLCYVPETDLCQLGLIASLWRYGEEERATNEVAAGFDVLPGKFPGVLPNLVVVQSESFFDPRDAFVGIRPEVLREFDLLKAAAVCHGKLDVPAWGANTVRTEFAFLSGVNAEMLGVHRFNPYRKAARKMSGALPSYLKQLGYKTICVHPYPASFYSRDKVFPVLGFDEFIDIRSFEGIVNSGSYIGDIALAEKVCTLLQSSSRQPIFLFVITMENHGPLHAETVRPGEIERFYYRSPPRGCAELSIYLRHLSNADGMMGILRRHLENLPGNHWMCWYGDHVPIMPNVYKTMGFPKGWTDYLIWKKGCSSRQGVVRIMTADSLGRLLVEEMRLGANTKHG